MNGNTSSSGGGGGARIFGTSSSSLTRNTNFVAMLLGMMEGVPSGREVMHHSNHYSNLYYYDFFDTRNTDYQLLTISQMFYKPTAVVVKEQQLRQLV